MSLHWKLHSEWHIGRFYTSHKPVDIPTNESTNIQRTSRLDTGESSTTSSVLQRHSDSKRYVSRAKTISDARMVAEIRRFRHSAKKTPDYVDHWNRLISKHEGLRCRRGYDNPFNEEGFLKKMISMATLKLDA